MKKIKLFIAFILVIGLGFFLSTTNSNQTIAKEDKVDKEVKEKLKKQPKIPVIVKLKDDAEEIDEDKNKTKDELEQVKEKNKQKEDEVLAGLSNSEFDLEHKYNFVPALAGLVSKDGLKKLEQNDLVEFVLEEVIFYQQLAEAGPVINSGTVNGLGYDGTGQTVCILDSGVNYNHTNLGGGGFPNSKILGGFDFANSQDNNNDGDYDDPGDVKDEDPLDDQYHGTNVTGVVAADSTGGNTDIGIAPDAGIIALKTSNASGNTTLSDLMAGVDWCTSNKDTYNIVALNMSLGDTLSWNSTSACESNYQPLHDIFNVAKQAGIALFAASGNQGHNAGISYPACDSDVISVGSVYDTSPYNVVNSSNSGSLLDILAPGSPITMPEGSGFNTRSGTSYATPMAAGAAALLTDENSSLTPEQIRCALSESGVDTLDSSSGIIKPRIDVNAAISFNPTVSGNTSWTGGFQLYEEGGSTVNTGDDVPMGEDLFIKDGSSNIVGRVNVDCSANLGTDVSMDQDFGTYKAFIHNLANKDSVGDVSLYIPKGPGHNSVWMCPGASSLAQVTAGCAGGFALSTSSPDNGSYHLVTTDPTYWIVEGIENTGGFSQQDDAAVPQLPTNIIWKILVSLVALGAVIGVATFYRQGMLKKDKKISRKSTRKKKK